MPYPTLSTRTPRHLAVVAALVAAPLLLGGCAHHPHAGLFWGAVAGASVGYIIGQSHEPPRKHRTYGPPPHHAPPPCPAPPHHRRSYH
jgi:hypothetical protein